MKRPTRPIAHARYQTVLDRIDLESIVRLTASPDEAKRNRGPTSSHTIPHCASLHAGYASSVKITADVREYAANLSANGKAALGLDEAQAGMKEMSDKFNALGAQVYVDADKAAQGDPKAPHTTALDTEAADAAKNAGWSRRAIRRCRKTRRLCTSWPRLSRPSTSYL